MISTTPLLNTDRVLLIVRRSNADFTDCHSYQTSSTQRTIEMDLQNSTATIEQCARSIRDKQLRGCDKQLSIRIARIVRSTFLILGFIAAVPFCWTANCAAQEKHSILESASQTTEQETVDRLNDTTQAAHTFGETGVPGTGISRAAGSPDDVERARPVGHPVDRPRRAASGTPVVASEELSVAFAPGGESDSATSTPGTDPIAFDRFTPVPQTDASRPATEIIDLSESQNQSADHAHPAVQPESEIAAELQQPLPTTAISAVPEAHTGRLEYHRQSDQAIMNEIFGKRQPDRAVTARVIRPETVYPFAETAAAIPNKPTSEPQFPGAANSRSQAAANQQAVTNPSEQSVPPPAPASATGVNPLVPIIDATEFTDTTLSNQRLRFVPLADPVIRHSHNAVTNNAPFVSISQRWIEEDQSDQETQIALFIVTNNGTNDAHDVIVELTVDNPAVIQSALPEGSLIGKRRARIRIERLAAGEQREITLGTSSTSPANILVKARLSTESIQSFPVQNQYAAVNPKQQPIEVDGPDAIAVGDPVQYRAKFFNSTSQVLINPRIEVAIGNGMKLLIENEAVQGSSSLMPGQTLEAFFTAVAHQPGDIEMLLTASAENSPEITRSKSVFASEHVFETAVVGPQVIPIGADAEFGLEVGNISPNPVADVNVTLRLPVGLDVNVLDRNAVVNHSDKTITWYVEEIAAGQVEMIRFKVKATGRGAQLQAFEISALDVPELKRELTTTVAGESSIALHIRKNAGSILVGQQTEIQLLADNLSTETNRNVQLVVYLPEGVKPLPSKLFDVINGRMLLFAPFDLPGGGGQQIGIQVTGHSPGQKEIRATISSSSNGAISSDSGVVEIDPPQREGETRQFRQAIRGAELPQFDRR